MSSRSVPRRLASGLAALSVALGLGACTLTEGGVLETAVVPKPNLVTVSPDLPEDDVRIGLRHFQAKHYGLAELHFRKAVEAAPGDAEAWMGLAAAYDQLKQFKLADRAYDRALALTGPTVEFLNNRGYSYTLRGDYARASRDLAAASAKAPANERIQNNIKGLEGRVLKKS